MESLLCEKLDNFQTETKHKLYKQLLEQKELKGKLETKNEEILHFKHVISYLERKLGKLQDDLRDSNLQTDQNKKVIQELEKQNLKLNQTIQKLQTNSLIKENNDLKVALKNERESGHRTKEINDYVNQVKLDIVKREESLNNLKEEVLKERRSLEEKIKSKELEFQKRDEEFQIKLKEESGKIKLAYEELEKKFISDTKEIQVELEKLQRERDDVKKVEILDKKVDELKRDNSISKKDPSNSIKRTDSDGNLNGSGAKFNVLEGIIRGIKNEELNLSNQKLSQIEVLHLCVSLTDNNNVKRLNLHNTGLTDKSLSHITMMLSKNKKIQEIDLSDNQIKDWTPLKNIISQNETLIRIEFGNEDKTCEQIQKKLLKNKLYK